MPRRFRLLLVCLPILALAPQLALAIGNTPLHWSKSAVAENDQSLEHVTLRARAGGGLDTFIRFQMVNAGFKHGELTVTFKQEVAGGSIFAKEIFKRGEYQVFTDRMGLRAGKHVLEVKDGQLTAQMDFPSGVQATVSMTSQLSTMTSVDRTGAGYVFRELLVPLGRLTVNAHDNDGHTLIGFTATGFAMHDASTATAHKTYERSVQLHNLSAGSYILVDYIVLPPERGGRPLGFMVTSGKGKVFSAEVAKEVRENEKVDGKMDYGVPWLVTVLGKRGDARAAVRMTAERQVDREDDLADLGWMARKAVGAFMHPITYTLKGAATVELQSGPTDPPVTFDANVRYKYAQVR